MLKSIEIDNKKRYENLRHKHRCQLRIELNYHPFHGVGVLFIGSSGFRLRQAYAVTSRSPLARCTTCSLNKMTPRRAGLTKFPHPHQLESHRLPNRRQQLLRATYQAPGRVRHAHSSQWACSLRAVNGSRKFSFVVKCL